MRRDPRDGSGREDPRQPRPVLAHRGQRGPGPGSTAQSATPIKADNGVVRSWAPPRRRSPGLRAELRALRLHMAGPGASTGPCMRPAPSPAPTTSASTGRTTGTGGQHFASRLPGDAARSGRRAPAAQAMASARRCLRAAPGRSARRSPRRWPGRSSWSRPWKPSQRPKRSESETFSSDRFRRVDRRRALVLDHLARHQVAAVGGGVEQDVVRPALDAAFEHRLQRLVGGVAAVEGEVVAEQQAAPRRAAQPASAGAAGWRCPRGAPRPAPARRRASRRRSRRAPP